MTLPRPKSFPRLILAVSVAGFLLAGCGGNEDTPSPSFGGSLPPAVADQALSDPSDLSVTSVDLTTSAEYDSASNEVRIFALVMDQTGARVGPLNEHNFGVTLNPKTVARKLDPALTSLSTTVSGDRLVALVIDSSGSMSATTETGETRMEVAKEAARLFVGLMGSGDQTAIVDFDDAARIAQQLTADQTLLNAAIDSFTADGLTNLGGAMTEAVRAVGTRPGKRAAILLTDGDDTVDSVEGGPSVWLNNPASVRGQGLKLAQDNGLVIFTVGLGDDLSDSGLADLNTIASETGGQFFQAPTAAALLSAFSNTIPTAVEALPPAETYLLTFESSILAPPGRFVDVPYVLDVVYENAVAVHRAKFNGTYTVR